MKLVHQEFQNNIDMNQAEICVLTIENPFYFSKYLSELVSQAEGDDGRFILSKNGRLLDISRYMEVHSQLIPFSINQRTLLNKLYTKLSQGCVRGEQFVKTQELISVLNNYLNDLLFDYESELEYDDSIQLTDIFKGVNLKFCEHYNDITEKLLDYMMMVRELDKEKCFVFVHLKSYTTKEKLQLFYKSIILHQLNVLLIESHVFEKLEYEKNIVIDLDLCEISY